MTMLEWALKYAEQGFAVFPLAPRSKTPATAHGFKDATTDEAQIRNWWTKRPDANIGVATGHGLVVIDVDDKPEEGKLGGYDLKKWEKEHGELPQTWTVITGSGGMHYWYRTQENFKNTVEILGAIDVRSLGGYVVAPPSIHPNGKLYSWEASGDPDDIDIADLSGSALELLRSYGAKAGSRNKNKTPYKELKKLSAGSRQDSLVNLIGSLINLGLAPETIEESVRKENELKGDPPYTEEELRKQIFPLIYRGYTPTGDYTDTVAPAPVLDDGIKEDELEMPTLDMIEKKKIEWLELGYIPKGTITIVCGDGGVGKTSLWCSIAASISRGEQTLLTAGTQVHTDILRDNRKVMFFSGEDDAGAVLKGKLESVNADQKNIYLFDMADERFKDISFSSKLLAKLIAKYKPALCIFDPIQSFISKKVKMSERNAMRQEIEPLIQLGSQYGTAFLIIMHTNKQSQVWGRQRMADSADLWDVARSVLMVGDTTEEDRWYISQEKNSYAKLSGTIIYTIVEGVATWWANSDKKDRDFVQEISKAKTDAKQSGDIQNACNFILSSIAETKDKQMLVSELDDVMKAASFSSYMIRTAKAHLKEDKLIFYKRNGYEGQFYICTHKNRQG